MPNPTKRSRSDGGHASACTECQRRKGKCTGGRPCAFCVKTGRQCLEQMQIARIPLTRKNMDELQDRCRRLEAVIRTLDPALDIESYLGSPDIGVQLAQLATREPTSASDQASSHGSRSPAPLHMQRSDDIDGDDGDDWNLRRFEWQEGSRPPEADDPVKAVFVLADGMASLSLDSNKTGYLGHSSASALLRHVYRLLRIHRRIMGAYEDPFEQIEISEPQPPLVYQDLSTVLTEDSLLEAYFQYQHPMYPLVHEGRFKESLRQWRDGNLEPTLHWISMYRMMLITGGFAAAPDIGGAHDRLREEIFLRLRNSIEWLDFLSSGTLEGVITLALMGTYLQKMDKPNTGYNVLGMALRMAIGLGLYCEDPEIKDGSPSTLGQELRRRLWYGVVIMDVGSSITFGRPTVTSDKMHIRFPANVIDYDQNNISATLPPPTIQVTIYSAMIAHAQLAVLMSRIHLTFFINPRCRGFQPRNYALSSELVQGFDDQISLWLSALPSHFTKPKGQVPDWFLAPRAVVLWKGLNLRMLIHKCFLAIIPARTPAALMPEVCKCLSFALETIDSVNRFCVENPEPKVWRAVGWYGTYYTFQAALILITAILSAIDDASVGVWNRGVNKALDVLDILRESTPNAGRFSGVLRGCRDRAKEIGEAREWNRSATQDVWGDWLGQELQEFVVQDVDDTPGWMDGTGLDFTESEYWWG